MACRTGDACGLTLTRSGASRTANHSAVISDTIDALDAWCPPTLTPDRVSPDPVGVVHDRRRQPQHALLDAVEDREIELRLGGATAMSRSYAAYSHSQVARAP